MKDFDNAMLNPYEIYKSESVKVIPVHENKKADTTTSDHYFFKLLAPTAPDEVRKAWESAAVKTGVNLGDVNSKLTHVNAMFTLQLQDKLLERGNDFLGPEKETAIAATKRALYLMLNSETDEPKNGETFKEIAFYNAFLDNLYKL